MTSAREKALEKKIEKLEAEKASWACGHKAYRVCGKCADKLEENLEEAKKALTPRALKRFLKKMEGQNENDKV